MTLDATGSHDNTAIPVKDHRGPLSGRDCAATSRGSATIRWQVSAHSCFDTLMRARVQPLPRGGTLDKKRSIHGIEGDVDGNSAI